MSMSGWDITVLVVGLPLLLISFILLRLISSIDTLTKTVWRVGEVLVSSMPATSNNNSRDYFLEKLNENSISVKYSLQKLVELVKEHTSRGQ